MLYQSQSVFDSAQTDRALVMLRVEAWLIHHYSISGISGIITGSQGVSYSNSQISEPSSSYQVVLTCNQLFVVSVAIKCSSPD